jgi:hypothetical protein
LQNRLFDQNDYFSHFQKNKIKTFCDVVNSAKGVRLGIPGKTENKCCVNIFLHKYIEKEKQTDKKTIKWKDKKTKKKRDGKTNRQKHRKRERQTNRPMALQNDRKALRLKDRKAKRQ